MNTIDVALICKALSDSNRLQIIEPVFRRSTMKVPNFPFALHILLKFKCLK